MQRRRGGSEPDRRAGRAGGVGKRRGREEGSEGVPEATPRPRSPPELEPACLETRSYISEQSAPWHAGRRAVARCMRACYTLPPAPTSLSLSPSLSLCLSVAFPPDIRASVLEPPLSRVHLMCRVTFLAADALILTCPFIARREARAECRKVIKGREGERGATWTRVQRVAGLADSQRERVE